MELTRRDLMKISTGALGCASMVSAQTQDSLSSWNNGLAKNAIVDFVRATTDKSNPKFVPPEDRIATFDQDGTTWVEHPIYSQVLFAYDRVAATASQNPEWKTTAPFKYVISGDKAAMDKFTLKDLEAIIFATHSGMSVDAFQKIATDWMATAKHPRFNRPYSQMVYQPMLEVMGYLRSHGYRTYIVTGGGQEFVRVYSQRVYGIPPEQIIGSAGETRYTYKNGEGMLVKEPKLLLNNNLSGKPEDIYLFLGKRSRIAFGNSTGDPQMLEYTTQNGGTGFAALVLHDDAKREYAYGPAQGLPDTKIGTFTQALYDEAKAKDWTVISMKNDWKNIFSVQTR
jgi:hypothetical protein